MAAKIRVIGSLGDWPVFAFGQNRPSRFSGPLPKAALVSSLDFFCLSVSPLTFSRAMFWLFFCRLLAMIRASFLARAKRFAANSSLFQASVLAAGDSFSQPVSGLSQTRLIPFSNLSQARLRPVSDLFQAAFKPRPGPLASAVFSPCPGQASPLAAPTHAKQWKGSSHEFLAFPPSQSAVRS